MRYIFELCPKMPQTSVFGEEWGEVMEKDNMIS